MDTRTIINEVRSALEEKAARELYGSGTAQPIEAEIAERTIALLKSLRSQYTEMTELHDDWVANDISAKITAAAQAGGNLAGYSPVAWATWGQILPHVLAFLTATYDAQMPDGSVKTETPKQTLMRRYTQETQE